MSESEDQPYNKEEAGLMADYISGWARLHASKEDLESLRRAMAALQGIAMGENVALAPAHEIDDEERVGGKARQKERRSMSGIPVRKALTELMKSSARVSGERIVEYIEAPLGFGLDMPIARNKDDALRKVVHAMRKSPKVYREWPDGTWSLRGHAAMSVPNQPDLPARPN